jgi:hypothetical protein
MPAHQSHESIRVAKRHINGNAPDRAAVRIAFISIASSR